MGRRLRRAPLLWGAGPAGSHDLAEHAVLHPLRAPPVDRRHLFAADEHREMQMVAAGESGHAAAADLLSLVDSLPDLDVDGRQMSVQRLHAKTMVDDDAVAVDTEVAGMHDHAALRGGDRRLGSDGQVEPEVDLLIDVLALIDVGAAVGEPRLDL